MEPATIHHENSVLPPSGQGYFARTSDGIRLRIGHWQGTGAPKGTIFFYPGRGDYIELYGHSVTAFVSAGYDVLVIDWRGQGLSDRVSENARVGHVNSFSDYQRDVDALKRLADELKTPGPRFLVAHSMGACVALRSLIEGLEVVATAFSSPMFGIQMAAYERLAVGPLTGLMKIIGRGETFAPGFSEQAYVVRNPFEENALTNSKADYDRWIKQGAEVPALHIGGPSMGWLGAAMKEMRDLSSKASPDVPCLSLCCEHEETVDAKAIEMRMSDWPLGELVEIPGAKHELFQEVEDVRNSVFEQIIAFIDAHRLPAAGAN